MFDHLSRFNTWQILASTAARLPDKVAVIEGDRRTTFSELLVESERLATRLANRGLAKGDRAAVYLPNSTELVVVFYALQKLGVVVAWLNPSYRQNEVRFIIENSGAKALFLFDEWDGFNYLSTIPDLGPLADLETIIVVRHREGFSSPDPRIVTLADIGDSAPAPRGPHTSVGPDDLSMLLYTSGTTGQPKGAMITHSQAVRGGFSYALGVDATEDDIFLAVLPMSHSYGCGVLLVQPVVLGATLVLLDVFSPQAAFAAIEKEKVTLQLGAPAHYLLELAHPKRADYDLSSLRAGTIAGQMSPSGLITRVEQEMGVHIASFLGSSEVGPGLSIILPFDTPLDVRERAIGYPVPGTQAWVVDSTTGDELAAGEQGELLLSGWHVTQGYWRNPEETTRQIRDGRLYTGDLVVRDEDGCFSILGRLKDIINRGGFKVVPSEIEAIVVQLPGVAEACVVGTPNPVLGESICVCIRLEEGGVCPSLDEVRGFLEGRIAPFKLPDELLVLPVLPRMPGGVKVNRLGAGGVAELAKESQHKQVRSR
ncbi:MAG: class I adenylate-forming enzyme family protein [Thermoleophilia bacterium]